MALSQGRHLWHLGRCYHRHRRYWNLLAVRSAVIFVTEKYCHYATKSINLWNHLPQRCQRGGNHTRQTCATNLDAGTQRAASNHIEHTSAVGCEIALYVVACTGVDGRIYYFVQEIQGIPLPLPPLRLKMYQLFHACGTCL